MAPKDPRLAAYDKAMGKKPQGEDAGENPPREAQAEPSSFQRTLSAAERASTARPFVPPRVQRPGRDEAGAVPSDAGRGDGGSFSSSVPRTPGGSGDGPVGIRKRRSESIGNSEASDLPRAPAGAPRSGARDVASPALGPRTRTNRDPGAFSGRDSAAKAAPAPIDGGPHPGLGGKAPRGLIKTVSSETNYRKVAKLLVLLGQDQAAAVLSKLDPEQVERIAAEIATIPKVDELEARALLAEFRRFASSGRGRPAAPPGTGGVEGARAILETAFGEERGDALLKKVAAKTGLDIGDNPFAFLEDFEGDQVALLLKDETDAACALVLSRLSSQAAARAVASLEGVRRAEVLRRIGHLEKISPEVLERVAEGLREKARHVGRSAGEYVDGRAALAEILKRSAGGFGDRLLDELADEDPELGDELRKRLFTLEDVLLADDRAVQEKLRTMGDKDIAVLLAGRPPTFAEKLLSNLSSTRRSLVEEERSLLGPLRKSESDEAAASFLSWFRTEREAGRLVLRGDDDLV